MAASMSSADLREVRGLAQKLFGQCRDSSSLYKNLANDIRKLRNRLEDVEDQFADDKLRSQKEVKVLERVWTCRVVLTELDWTLQSFRCSTYKWQDVRPDTIDVLRKKIGQASRDLGGAFDALQEADDADEESSCALPSASDIETQAETEQLLPVVDEGAVTPSVSHTQSDAAVHTATPPGSPPNPKDVPLPASPPSIKRTMSDEKEVYDASGARRGSSPKIDSAVDWHNPFAEQDPLSMDIRSASAFLSGGSYQVGEGFEDSDDETDSIPASSARDAVRSAKILSGLGITPAKDAESAPNKPVKTSRGTGIDAAAPQALVTEVMGRHKHDLPPRVVQNAPVEENEREPHHLRSSQEQSAAAPLNASSHERKPAHIRSSSQILPQITSTSDATTREDAATFIECISRSPLADNRYDSKNEATSSAYHLPQIDFQSAFDLQQDDTSAAARTLASEMQRPMHPQAQTTSGEMLPATMYTPPIVSSKASSEDMSASSRADSKVEVFALSEPQDDKSALAGEKIESIVTETAIGGNEHAESRPDAKSLDAIAVRFVPTEEITQPLTTPKPPTRKPPSPPPRRRVRRHEPQFPSMYKINNPSPPTRSNTDASEDLYSSSRPTSPTLALFQTQQQSPRTVPVVKIDSSALEVKTEPPQVPRRPARYPAKKPADHHRVTTGVPHMATMLRPGVRAGTELEADGKLHSRRSDIGLNPRKSVDETLGVNNSLLSPSDESFRRSRSVSAPERQRSLSVSDLPRAVKPPPSPPQQPLRTKFDVREYYSNPTLDFHAEGVDLNAERIARICQCWNSQNYNEAEAYLMGQLEFFTETQPFGPAHRRVRHLLGVCLSFKGEWERALPLFVSVLRAPITDPSELDAGDCAAAYWLGDTYALLNRRTEALLAYCMAEQGEAVRNTSTQLGLQSCLDADQQAVQLGVSKADFKVRWAQESLANREAPEDTILSPRIITQQAAKACLELKPRSFRSAPITLTPDKNRAALLFSADKSSRDFRHNQRLTITPEAFVPHTAWPMPYDPLFTMANVSRGRLIAYECDLIDVFTNNHQATVPKSGPLGTSRMSCFTCQDLTWLIRTLRKCLETLDMKWSEVANVEGVWFLVRQTLMQDKVATVHYFSIALFRQSLRSGYGVEICPDGVGSARMTRVLGFVNGVPQGVEKNTRKFIREFLEAEYRACAKTERGTVLPKRRSLLRSKPVVAELDGAPSVAALGSKERRAGGLEAVVEGSPKMSVLRKREAQMSPPPPPVPPRPTKGGQPMRSEARVETRDGYSRGYRSVMVAYGKVNNG